MVKSMEKFMNFFNDKIAMQLMKVSNNRYISVIGKSFMATMPLSIVGAIFTMFRTLPLGAAYTEFLTKTNLIKYLAYPQAITTDIIALVIAFTIAYNLAKVYKLNELIVGLVSLASFLLVTPFGTNVKLPDGTMQAVTGVIPTQWLGAQGLFVAMFIGIIVAEVYRFCMLKKLFIKLPDGVPENVSKSFEGLIPAGIALLIFLVVRIAFEQTSFGSVHALVYGLIQKPLQSLGNSLPAYLIAILLMQLLWVVGIHGPLVVASILLPIWSAAANENLQLFNAGQAPIHIINTTFYFMYGSGMGGSGNTLGLAFLMAFRSKSAQFKTLGRLSLAPAVFNINEPLTFGVPFVMNPITFVPFVFIPVLSAFIAYVATASGLVGILPGLGVVSQAPIIMKAIMGGGNSIISVALLQVFLAVLSTILWYPFFKIMDSQAYEQETAALSTPQDTTTE